MPAGPLKAVQDSLKRRKRAINTCQLYKSPTTGQQVNSSTPVTFAWNTECFSPNIPRYVNIALLSSRGEVFRWEDVDAASGSYETQLDASWWDNLDSIQLQVGITATDTPLFLSPFVAGPVFTALNSNPNTETLSATGTAAEATPTGLFTGGYLNVAKLSSQGLSRGQLAAAILMPILVAIVAISGYVWFSRRREARRRAKWMESVDKRMSTISTDWQSLSQRGVSPSMHSSRRTPRPSVHSRRMSMLGGAARVSISTDAEMKSRSTLYERFSTHPFATEDETQLGPRARALSAAAAEGRPLSSLINASKDLPSLPDTHIRSNSTATSGPPHPMAPHSHTRTISTTSNNPYASSMAHRDSIAGSNADKSLPFPSVGGPIPRPRMNSQARSADAVTRSRVISHVSFVDTPLPSQDRRRNADPEKSGMRSSPRENSTGDDFAVDLGDSLPALALMRVKSGGGLDGVDFPTADSSLTPTREFLPRSNRGGYFDSPSNAGLAGRTPDEMLKAYASTMSSSEKVEDTQAGNSGTASSTFSAFRRFTTVLWRK